MFCLFESEFRAVGCSDVGGKGNIYEIFERKERFLFILG